jgi:hypothetical protein
MQSKNIISLIEDAQKKSADDEMDNSSLETLKNVYRRNSQRKSGSRFGVFGHAG